MVKCFWCGAINEKKTDTCCSCGRKMEWSNFFKALLKPSVGCLLGHDAEEEHAELVGAGSGR
jgi:hypothetical protein